METDLEALNIYLLGIYWDLQSSGCCDQCCAGEREKGCSLSSPPPLWMMERASFCHREVKTQEELNGKDVFFPSNNTVVFF